MKIFNKVNPVLAIVFICCGIIYYLQNGIKSSPITTEKPSVVLKNNSKNPMIRKIASNEVSKKLNPLKENIFCQSYAEDCVNKLILQGLNLPGVDPNKTKTYKITCRVSDDKFCLTKGKFTVSFESLEKRKEFIDQLRIYNKSILENTDRNLEEKNSDQAVGK